MRALERVRNLRKSYGLSRGLLREVGLQFDRLVHRVNEFSLAKDLRGLGIEPGDVIFVHSSMRELGHVVGGPAAVIRALEMTVGSHGTIVMPAYSTGGLPYYWVKNSPTFDVKKTPSDVGVIAEVFRLQSETIRSLHPTHSVCARGPRAKYLTERHEIAERPFGHGTPFMRLAELGGKGLILGARLRNFTALRIIEDHLGEAYPVRVYLPDRFSVRVIDDRGQSQRVETLVPDPEWGRRRNGDLLLPHLLEKGLINKRQVGKASSLLIRCAELLRVLEDATAKGILAYRI
jgi:aminoglycoside 3-N-acetyltransferase